MVTNAGLRLSPGIRIPEDASYISIAQDGTVTAAYEGSTEEVTLGTIRVVDVANPSGLQAMGGNLYSATPASGEPVELYAEDGVDIRQGFLEASNVDIAEELVSMIVAQRAFELTSKVVQTADGLGDRMSLGDHVYGVATFEVDAGRVTDIRLMVNPAKLTSWLPER
jgi:flagellar basal-body rod protein FlgG